MTGKKPGGTFRRIGAPRYAKPTKAQRGNFTGTGLCPECHQRRPVVHGKIQAHQTSRDARGAVIFPAVQCGGAGRKALASGLDAGGWMGAAAERGER